MNSDLKLFDSIPALPVPKMCAVSCARPALTPDFPVVRQIAKQKTGSTARPEGLHNESPVSDKEAKSGRTAPQNEELERHYSLIGETLLTAEAGALQAGIPWLPPTAQRRALRSKYDAPLPDFIRYSLVGVQTRLLESYCDDLESSVLPEETGDRLVQLHLGKLSWWERYAFCLFSSVAFFLFLLTTSLVLGVSSSTAAAMSAATGILSCAGCYLLSQEEQRRASFHRILYREILRRRGLNEPNAGRIRVMSVEPN